MHVYLLVTKEKWHFFTINMYIKNNFVLPNISMWNILKITEVAQMNMVVIGKTYLTSFFDFGEGITVHWRYAWLKTTLIVYLVFSLKTTLFTLYFLIIKSWWKVHILVKHWISLLVFQEWSKSIWALSNLRLMYNLSLLKQQGSPGRLTGSVKTWL